MTEDPSKPTVGEVGSVEPKRDAAQMSRLDLLRAGVAGLTGITVLGALTGAGCASERLVRDGAPPKTDPKLIKFREVSQFSPDFHWIRGLCTDGTSLWVAGDMAVREFAIDGTRRLTHELPGAAKCVAWSPDGRLFAATDDRVHPIGEEGTWSSLGPRARIVSIVADARQVVVADAGNRCVVRFDHQGTEIGRFGAKSADYPGLVVPSPYIGLSLHPSGDLVVTNIGRHRVERHGPDGRLVEAVGEPGMGMDAFCGCCNPTHVSVLPNGDMVTAEKGLPRVKVISPDGSLKCVVAGPECFHTETLGLATAAMGSRVLVLDPWEGAVRVFAPV
ncbi:MAG: hypothetical protein P4L46_10050 [Fimbriimonas sp.]|nr:hypothetical protein [Fimbriimonas sp.]